MDMCETKYPILLVHGTGFRDRKRLGYWGRIPKSLEARGARIFYGHQDSWGTVERNAEILRRNLAGYLRDTGCDKVNIIAHSKGGVEARYLISSLKCGNMAASLTTVSTPHHGSKTMDIITKLPACLLRLVSVFVNLWFRLLGDKNPDFQTACGQFTTGFMRGFNAQNPDDPGVYYQSFATVMKNPLSDIFMCFPSFVVGRVEGKNDGLITPSAAAWTNFRGVWEGATARGISHADAVDLRRRRLSSRRDSGGVTDICDCYVNLVRELKEMGL